MGLLNTIIRSRPDYVDRFNVGLLLIFLTVATGVVGYMAIEELSFFDAFYMTIITVSTVGFGEVYELSKAGRIFTAFLIITNIGIFTYAISIIASFVVEGHLGKALKRIKVINEVSKLNNHTIICGGGRNGIEACMELHEHKQHFVVIEQNAEKIEKLRSKYKFIVLEGDAAEDEILKQAGIETAKALISTLPKDADNVFVALTAREINPNLNIICRASEESTQPKLIRAGASQVIMPEKIGGSHMAQMVISPEAVDFFSFLSGYGGPGINFQELDLDKMSDTMKNKTISDLEIRKQTGANIIGMRSQDGEYVVNPSHDTLLSTCSKLIVLGDEQQIQNFKKYVLND